MTASDDKAAKAKKLIDRRVILSESAFAEMVLWELPAKTEERPHGLKYRLALVVAGACVMRFDNERGKGDHIHVGQVERPYDFRGVDQLIEDFLAEVKEWTNANRNS